MRVYRFENRLSARVLLTLGVSLTALAGPALAQGPKGGVVVRGAATISADATRTTIRQSANRAVIDWDGFDVSAGHTVDFVQPGRSSVTLNRVRSPKASVIAGALRAPGTVVIQNTSGVIFAGSARIDTGSLLATSQTVDIDAFTRDGGLRIGGGEAAGARVVNQGTITVGEAGLAALVGGDVENAGAIVARRGTVALASGARTAVDFTGDGVISFVSSGTGTGRVTNSGSIDAPDGRILLSAGAASRTLDAVINTTGVLRATSASGDGGSIDLTADGAVRIAGAVDVSGARRGGQVTATGARVDVTREARIDTTGASGGTVRLGGDRGGLGPLRRADHLTFAAGAAIDASGSAGRGGSVVLWSDGRTEANGTISATGSSGGGFVETSGLEALGVGPTASVAVGTGGEWLLDPRDIVIGATGLDPVPPGTTAPPPGTSAFIVDRDALALTLDGGGDVTLTTTQPASAMAGDITLSSPLTWTGSGMLRLSADRDIVLNLTLQPGAGGLLAEAGRDIAAKTTLRGSSGDVTLAAGRDITTSGTFEMAGDGDLTVDAGGNLAINHIVRSLAAGDVTLRARTGNLTVTENPIANLGITANTGRLRLEATEGSILLRRINPRAASNIQISSLSGGMDLAAGTRILLEGGTEGGRWVRVGRDESSSDVTLTAPDITIQGGSKGNTFAKVVTGTGGSITMDADRITVQNGAGDQGRIFALNGADLVLRGETQIWNGPVRVGSGARDGGNVTVSGNVTAGFQPMLSLAPGRTFTFAPEAPKGTLSAYVSTEPLSIFTSGTGAIDVDTPVLAGQILLESEERVGLGPSGSLTGQGPGDALVVAAGRTFRNASSAGSGALATPDGDARWLLYVDTFAGLTGPAPTSGAPDLYGRAYSTVPPDALGFEGNRTVYGERPVLTLTAETLAKTYGTALVPGFTLAGLRAGDTLGTALDLGPTVQSAGAAATAGVGRYATTVSADASDQGYLLAFADGVLDVTPAALRITANDAGRTYGSANPDFEAAFDGFVLGEDAGTLSGTLALATPATVQSDAGRYAITPSGLSNPNYAITFVPGTLTVDPAALTVTAADARRLYGAANPALTAGVTGFVLGQSVTDLGGTLAVATTATPASDVDTYAVTAAGLSSANYAITFVDGALRVDPAPLTVTPGARQTYGGSATTDTSTFAGFVLGQDRRVLEGALALQTPATPTSDAGTYALTGSGLSNPNYVLTFVTGTLTIDRAPLTVRAADATRTYGAGNPALAADIDGFVLGQTVAALDGTLAVTTRATPQSDVGRYAVTATGLGSNNYAITYVPGMLAVTPAALSVTPGATRTYGSAATTDTTVISGFVLGQDRRVLQGSLALQTPATPTSDAGTYGLTGSGLSNPNYVLTFAPGTLTIDRASLTVRANDASRPQGTVNPTFTANLDGFVLGQDASVLTGTLVFDTDATPTSASGTYAVTPGGVGAANYAITFADGLLTVQPGSSGVIADPLAGFDQTLDFARGVPPFTPGDAAFRTTVSEAPPSLQSPFALTYSLGQITTLAPAGAAPPAAADTGGFAPAAGGFTAASGEGPGDPGACAGQAPNLDALPAGSAMTGCARETGPESFWTSAFPQAAQ